MWDQLFTFLKHFTIYCHSPGGTAAALSDTTFYTTYIQSSHGDNATALEECALSECSYYITVIIAKFRNWYS